MHGAMHKTYRRKIGSEEVDVARAKSYWWTVAFVDWEKVRAAKARCENRCACFNYNLGGCSLGLLANLQCDRLTEKGKRNEKVRRTKQRV